MLTFNWEGRTVLEEAHKNQSKLVQNPFHSWDASQSTTRSGKQSSEEAIPASCLEGCVQTTKHHTSRHPAIDFNLHFPLCQVTKHKAQCNKGLGTHLSGTSRVLLMPPVDFFCNVTNCKHLNIQCKTSRSRTMLICNFCKWKKKSKTKGMKNKDAKENEKASLTGLLPEISGTPPCFFSFDRRETCCWWHVLSASLSLRSKGPWSQLSFPKTSCPLLKAKESFGLCPALDEVTEKAIKRWHLPPHSTFS